MEERVTEASSTQWYRISASETIERLGTSENGLSEKAIRERKAQYGPNSLPKGKGISLMKIILSQFKDPLIYILLAAGLVSVLIGEADDAFFILIVVLLNAVIGATQEFKAEKSARALLEVLKTESRVVRDAKTVTVDSSELVPGDVVLLESGEKVSADLRLTSTNNLTVDESFLTGESTTVEKTDKEIDEELEIADRSNLAFAGSMVITGRGKGVVVATGSETELGKIAEVVSSSEKGKAPLVIRMERFTKKVAYLVLFAAGAFALIRFLQGYELSDVFFLAVALAVSAIPEGLPVALTVALSVATSRMARRHVIVRKLEAVESLGSCTVIASDKTGTLTVNQQTAKILKLASGEAMEVTGEGYNGDGEIIEIGEKRGEVENLLKIASIANEASLERQNGSWQHSGDAMDVALLGLTYKGGLTPEEVIKNVRILKEVPYESANRYSAAFYESEGKTFLAVKGALETVLAMCSQSRNENDRSFIERQSSELTGKGYRVLAFASGQVDSVDNSPEELDDLEFAGIVGFIDPLRSEVKGAVEECQEAGIKVVMITGDHPSTAGAIALELGITDRRESVVTGRELEEAGDPEGEEFGKLVESSSVFARVSPVQKLYIVEALKNMGHFVAVTGDGVNDAPALQRANIGVAMGSGTDVAKETGSIIVTDDNFASIVSGVEEGRFAYANVRKVIYLLISTGAAELILFVLAVTLNLPLPLLAVQILWLNLVTNGIQDVALAFEKGEPGVMRKPPRRPDHSIFDRLMLKETLLSGATMGFMAFFAWLFLLNSGWDEVAARNILLMLFVLMQNVHVFNCRSEETSLFKVPLRRNYLLVLGVLGAHALHILATNVPWFQSLLGVSPVSPIQWMVCLVLALPLMLVMESFKAFSRKVSNSL